jgi:hypothetical protein
MMHFILGLLILEIVLYSQPITQEKWGNHRELSSQSFPDPFYSTSTNLSFPLQFNVVDPRGWDLTWSQQYIFSSVEAIVNQNRSRLFVIYDETELVWYQSMDRALYNGTMLPVTSLRELCEYYSSEIEGLIIYDNLPESANIATPMVGQYHAIMVHSELLSYVQNFTGFLNKPILQNITALYQTKGFTDTTTRGEIYRWAFDSFYSNYNKSALALLNTGISSHLRAFLCTERIFTLWQPVMTNISGAPEDDELTQNAFRYILANTPQDMIVFGYMFPDGKNEHPVVRALSENGKYLVPSDFSKNLPFYHHLPIPTEFQFSQNRSLPTPQLENKIYIAGIFSDGDNIQYVANFMRTQYWESARRKATPVPISYEISPSLLEIAPYLLYYYYNTATINDYFVPGVGGKGYTLSEYMSERYFTQYYQSTLDLMQQTDMKEMRTWVTPISDMIKVFANYNPAYKCEGVYDGYGGRGVQSPYLENQVVVSSMKGYAGGPEDDLVDLDALKSIQKGPMFVCYHLFCWDTPYNSWADFVGNVSTDPRFEVVTLYQLTDLIAKYYEQSGVVNPTPRMLETLWIISIFVWIGGFLIFEYPAIRHLLLAIFTKKSFIVNNEERKKKKMGIKLFGISIGHLIELSLIITMLFFSQPLRIRGLFELLGQTHLMHFVPIERFYLLLISAGVGYLVIATLYRVFEKKIFNKETDSHRQFVPFFISLIGFGIGLLCLLTIPWNIAQNLFLIGFSYFLFAGIITILQIGIKTKA